MDHFILERLTADRVAALQPALSILLADAVDNGASVNFIAPLDRSVAESYWARVAREVEAGQRLVIVALSANRVAGSVQLGLSQPPNGQHRADLQKMLVHRDFRRQGLATRLLTAAEDAARQAGRILLVLDTEQGSPAESLYEKAGYRRAGIIPDYARNYNGTSLIATVVFYKRL